MGNIKTCYASALEASAPVQHDEGIEYLESVGVAMDQIPVSARPSTCWSRCLID